MARQYALYNDELMPTFKKHGDEIISHGDRNPAYEWVDEYFEREVRPLESGGAGPGPPVPASGQQVAELHRAPGWQGPLRTAERDRHRQGAARAARLIRMRDKVAGRKTLFVSLSSVIRAHLHNLFPGRDVGQFSQFRVTRHSDLAVDEDDVRTCAPRQGLQHRHHGQAVRLEGDKAGCSEFWRLPHQAVPCPVLYVRNL